MKATWEERGLFYTWRDPSKEGIADRDLLIVGLHLWQQELVVHLIGSQWIRKDELRLGSKPGYSPYGLSPSDLPKGFTTSPNSTNSWGTNAQTHQPVGCIWHSKHSNFFNKRRVVIQRHEAHDSSVRHSETLKPNRKWKSEHLLHRPPPIRSEHHHSGLRMTCGQRGSLEQWGLTGLFSLCCPPSPQTTNCSRT